MFLTSSIDERPTMAAVCGRGDQNSRQELVNVSRNRSDQEWNILQEFAQNMSTVCRRKIEGRDKDNRWTLISPRTSWDFIDFGNIDPILPLFDIGDSTEVQIVEDLFNCFLGFHGRYITAESLPDPRGTRLFRISDHITGVSRSTAKKLLPLASFYSRVVRFIQSGLNLSAGRVNQALAGYLQEKIITFTKMIISLELLQINLNQLYSYLLATLPKMQILSDIAYAVQNLRGGQTLTAIYSLVKNHIIDSDAYNICLVALTVASEPYFESLSMWIFHGILFDPFEEFMIVQKRIYKSSNWDNMFSINESEVPEFIRNYQLYVFNAGKYLYTIRQSLENSDVMPHCNEEVLVYDLSDKNSFQMLIDAYDFARMALLDIMLNRFNLFERIKTIKSFLCLEGGDLFHNIIDHCEKELSRPAHEVCVSYLSSLIKTSIKSSSLGNLRYADQIALFLEKETLRWQVYTFSKEDDVKEEEKECHEEQSGMDALTLKVKTSWPISIVMHQVSIKYYQMLFRQIFYLKRVYFKLVTCRYRFRSNVGMKEHYLKHTMTVFLQCCLSYMTMGNVEVHWLEFQEVFHEAASIESIREAHENMLYKCLKGSMLNSPKLFHKLRKALKICLKFTKDLSIVHEKPFLSAVSGLINAAISESSKTGLENFIKEIVPVFQYEPRINVMEIHNSHDL